MKPERFPCKCNRSRVSGLGQILHPPDPRVVELLRVVAEAIGIATPRIYADPTVDYAQVDERDHIYYKPAFFEALFLLDPSGLLVLAVLAHEIGHIYNEHLSKPWEDPWEQELEADRFAGCVLSSLCEESGAFQRIIRVLSRSSTSRHPPGEERSRAIQEGWESCARVCNDSEKASPGSSSFLETAGKVAGGVVIGIGIVALLDAIFG